MTSAQLNGEFTTSVCTVWWPGIIESSVFSEVTSQVRLSHQMDFRDITDIIQFQTANSMAFYRGDVSYAVWEYANRSNSWAPFSSEHCMKIEEAVEKGAPTVLLSNSPVVFVNLRTFMMRNTSNNIEVGIRRRQGKTQPAHIDTNIIPMKTKVNEIMSATSSVSVVKPGRFALAWATEVEECRRKVENLTRAIFSILNTYDQSKLSALTSTMRDLGSLIQENTDARKAFAAQSSQDVGRIVTSQAILLSSTSETAHECASLVLANLLQDERSRAIVQASGAHFDKILAGLLRMVSGPGAASCTRQRHAIFALQALTASPEGQQRLLAVRRSLPSMR
jgi:hypothetical protein